MKTFSLKKYSENGELSDLDDADFLARKLGEENKLDFSGISSVRSEKNKRRSGKKRTWG